MRCFFDGVHGQGQCDDSKVERAGGSRDGGHLHTSRDRGYCAKHKAGNLERARLKGTKARLR